MRRTEQGTRRTAVLFLLLLGWLVPLALAHDNPHAPVPSLRALKVEAPLTVDGVLDEPFWERCEVTSGLIDQRTHLEAEQQTRIRIAYTRTHLYVAVECLDDHPDDIRASERREDRVFQGDDWVEVHFDPPHNHRGKYAFFANPLGTRADANEGPSGLFNYGWSADWDLAAKIHTNGWTFEMRIPLKVLNYLRKDAQTWGFNITRMLRRTDTTSFWSFSATEVYKPRHFGHLTGLDLADAVFDRNWEVSPYVSVRTDFDGATRTTPKAGLDVGVRLSPTVTTAWTLKPDFGQVEADDDTIELRDTERFLPEKRLFFREGDELMRTTHQLYYSRRFTDIDGGMKASGLGKGYSFALLNLQSDIAHDGRFHGNSTVLRVLQDVKERSSLGYYLGDSEVTGGHSRVLGADGYLFLNNEWRYRFQLAGMEDNVSAGRAGRDRFDYLGSASMIYARYPWEFNVTYNAISEQFNPLLGYIPRRNIFGPSVLGSYHRESGRDWYKRLSVTYQPQLYLNADQRTVLRDHGLYGSVVWRNDLGLRLSYNNDYHAPYHNHRVTTGVDVFASDYWKAINLTWAHGRFETTDYNEFVLGKRYKFWERLPIRHEFVVRLADRPGNAHETVWLDRIIFDLFITDKMWIKSSLQHRHNGVRNLSLIYGWKLHPKIQWYLVFNNVNDGAEEGNSIFTKVSYTF
jgi:hypothetical protein